MLDRLFGDAKRAAVDVNEFERSVAEAVLRVDRDERAIKALRLLALFNWFSLFLFLSYNGLLRRAVEVSRHAIRGLQTQLTTSPETPADSGSETRTRRGQESVVARPRQWSRLPRTRLRRPASCRVR